MERIGLEVNVYEVEELYLTRLHQGRKGGIVCKVRETDTLLSIARR